MHCNCEFDYGTLPNGVCNHCGAMGSEETQKETAKPEQDYAKEAERRRNL